MMRESRMPDYPSAATAAAIEAIRGEYPMITPAMLSGLATLALDAAAPLLADPVARAITHQIRGWAGSFVAADPAVASLVAELLRVLDGIAPAAKPPGPEEAAAYLTITCHRCGYGGTDRAYEDQGDGTWLCSACPAPEEDQ
jgi:hypothetical protein